MERREEDRKEERCILPIAQYTSQLQLLREKFCYAAACGICIYTVDLSMSKIVGSKFASIIHDLTITGDQCQQSQLVFLTGERDHNDSENEGGTALLGSS